MAAARRKKNIGLCAAAFVLTFAIMYGLYGLYGYAPFGDVSLAWEDANIQYLSFFSYLKDVMAGENDIAYTFSKSLGGSNIGVLAYYLMSPFNLLLIFFEKFRLHDFFDLITALKLSTAACTFTVFLNGYFSENDRKLHHDAAVLLLSLSYGLCQYCIAQSSNTIWLDGVYMLPLILLGVRKLVRGESSWQLPVFVGLSILFNWYTGGINCLFSIIWFFFELVIQQTERSFVSLSHTGKDCVASIFRYGCAMVIGVLLSCALFLPTVYAMQRSGRGSLEFSSLLDLSPNGAVTSLISLYTLGAKSSYGNISLFCGSFALLGCIGCFFTKRICRRKKRCFGLLALAGFLALYWNPLYVAFSLFKSVGSFWCRYAYVAVVIILFLAAQFYLTCRSGRDLVCTLVIGVGFAALLLVFNHLGRTQNAELTVRTAASMVLIAAAVALAACCAGQKRWMRLASLALAILLAVSELAYGAKLQMDNYHMSTVAAYEAYVPAQQAQIDGVLAHDPGTYRISQTTTRYTNQKNLTAHYDEALAYNFRSITSYTSAPDDIQLRFLDRLGYRSNGDTMSIVNTAIVGADALLGVKYVLSAYPIAGLEEVEELGQANGKSVYENPYALPMALCYDETDLTVSADNPFTYQNQLYSQLLGETVELYIPLDYQIVQKEDTVVYEVALPAGNYACYGNLPWIQEFNAMINVNGVYSTGYACWLSPSVFYIPGGDGKATLEISAGGAYHLAYGEEQFYALDLDRLAEVSAALSAREAEEIRMENGRVYIRARASENQRLYLSVPYDDNWTVTLNGREVEPELFGDCLYSFALEEGANEVEMVYRADGIAAGWAASALGLTALAVWTLWEKKRKTAA